MEDSTPSMTRLFDQLGLPSRPAEIQLFFAEHRPLPEETVLFEAPFWTQSQAEFLRAEMQGDTDWAVVIERVNAALRSTKPA